MLVSNKKLCRLEGCNNLFTPIRKKHFFCHRRCFNKWYHRIIKEEKYPSWICPVCNEQKKLNFHPKQSEKKLLGIICSHCDHKNE